MTFTQWLLALSPIAVIAVVATFAVHQREEKLVAMGTGYEVVAADKDVVVVKAWSGFRICRVVDGSQPGIGDWIEWDLYSITPGLFGSGTWDSEYRAHRMY